jgi:hypothetical protein
MNPADLAQLEELVEKSAREPWRYGGALHRALRALLSEHAIPEGYKPVPIALIDFLLGEGEWMGQHFGENIGRANYWWRTSLRAAKETK